MLVRYILFLAIMTSFSTYCPLIAEDMLREHAKQTSSVFYLAEQSGRCYAKYCY